MFYLWQTGSTRFRDAFFKLYFSFFFSTKGLQLSQDPRRRKYKQKFFSTCTLTVSGAPGCVPSSAKSNGTSDSRDEVLTSDILKSRTGECRGLSVHYTSAFADNIFNFGYLEFESL